jgi:hypothetical protein
MILAEHLEISPGCVDDRSQMHDVLMRDIAIRENTAINPLITDKFGQDLLVLNGNPVRVEGTGQFSRVTATVDFWDLSSREGHYLIIPVVSKDTIEVMKIASGSADNDDPLGGHLGSPWRTKEPGASHGPIVSNPGA